MKVEFWGVRGSIPSPLTPEQIKSKIQAVVQRISVKDLKSQDSRQNFIDNLPDWLNGTVGGNTSCVTVTNKNDTNFILDAGSGIRLLGKKLAAKKQKVFHIFFSHFHWDHIQGLPFFDPFFNPNSEIHFYSPKDGLKDFLEQQADSPYFPVKMKNMNQENMYFHKIDENQPLFIDGTKITCKKMCHPDDSYSYCFEEDEKKVIYATDVELQQKHIEENSIVDFFSNSDMLILDSQYTAPEAIQKENWGHSSYSYAVDFSISCKIKQLYFFHHEPMYDDKKLNTILQNARMYADYANSQSLKIYLAEEGKAISI